LEPIKGIGPKSALKLIREHGSLGAIVSHIREKAEERDEAEKHAVGEEDEEADTKMKEGEAKTSEGECESESEEETKRKEKRKKTAKKRGGVRVPEDWPWEAAKKLFETPDVVAAEEVEVRAFCWWRLRRADGGWVAELGSAGCGGISRVPGERKGLQV
jgi:flap endonuclease-1